MRWHGLSGFKTDEDCCPCITDVDLFGDKIVFGKLSFFKQMYWFHGLPPKFGIQAVRLILALLNIQVYQPEADPPQAEKPALIFVYSLSSLISLTITSGSMLCIIAPKEIDSIFIPGQVKHPVPKYFWITLTASGFCFRTSPITVSFVIFFSAMLTLRFYFGIRIANFGF